MQIGKKELAWSYAAQILSVASGLIVLPAILRFLSEAEIGFNYILLSVGAIVSLIDFGFTPQFSRNITFVYSGARVLLKEGVDEEGASLYDDVDYHLLKTVIATARWVYSILGVVALGLMLTLGTLYVYHVTDGFQIIDHAGLIWVLYSISVFFSIHYNYYGALLFGSGQLTKRYMATIITQTFVIVSSCIVLYLGYGLLGRVVVLMIAPFLLFVVSHLFYFTRELKQKISCYTIRLQEKKELFAVLWYNAKRGGLCKLSEMFTSQGTVMIAGAFLTLGQVASFGLMQQLFYIAGNISSITLNSYQPQLAYWFAKREKELVVKKMAWAMLIFYLVFGLELLAIVFVASPVFEWIGSNSRLPGLWVMLIYGALRLLELNYQNFNQYYVLSNRYPFVKSVIVTGVGVVVCAYVFTAWLPLGIWGLIMAIGVCQLSWMDWYWPRQALREMQISFRSFLHLGWVELRQTVKGLLYSRTVG